MMKEVSTMAPLMASDTSMPEKSASFVRIHNLSTDISLLQALRLRYLTESTKEEEYEMYVLSASSKRVSVHLLSKEKIQDKVSRFEELTGVSLSYLGVSNLGSADEISATLPNLKELDLTGNLLSDWKDVGIICEQLPALQGLKLSNNLMMHDVTSLPQLKGIRVLVLSNTGINLVPPPTRVLEGTIHLQAPIIKLQRPLSLQALCLLVINMYFTFVQDK